MRRWVWRQTSVARSRSSSTQEGSLYSVDLRLRPDLDLDQPLRTGSRRVRIGSDRHGGKAGRRRLLPAQLLAPADHLAGMHPEPSRHS